MMRVKVVGIKGKDRRSQLLSHIVVLVLGHQDVAIFSPAKSSTGTNEKETLQA